MRKVLFDAFGTFFCPRTPVANQYADVARSSGLDVDAEQVKDGFKKALIKLSYTPAAYKHWAKAHPMYGRFSQSPLDPTLWWSGLIRDTFLRAGFQQVESQVTTTLIERFWCAEGYALHDDVLPAFQRLGALSHTVGASSLSHHFAVVSGSDPGAIKVLRSLGLLVDGSSAIDGRAGSKGEGLFGIKEEEIFTTWAIGKEKHDVKFWEAVLERLRVIEGEDCKAEEFLIVGDELCLLLRRSLSEYARMTVDDELGQEDGVESVRSLVEVADWIEKRHSG
ncbi:BQ2448_767 [Microbotryum intermedium]|uniref:BQ2448_767 protein n=1 Tax=Microbotryum intermedium TaxID=269621 RepID=A0A238FC48_9BASI|nr:BQ2448_767 [Microbotryum intermedium]